jgi:hypothetical protein
LWGKGTLKKPSALKFSLHYRKHIYKYVLEILYLNIKILTGIISWIVLCITSLENLSITLSETFLNTTE